MRTAGAALALSAAACGGQKDTKNESADSVATPTAPETAKPQPPAAPPPSGRDHIAAWFTDENASAMRRLKHYQEVFIRCRGGGMLDVPQLRDCVLEQVVP